MAANRMAERSAGPAGGDRGSALAAGLLLAALCGLAIGVNWLKLLNLWGDAGIGLLEAQRVAQGQLPYQDFALRYPPLSTILLGLAFRLFGDTFTTAQVFYNVLSVIIVFLTWLLARRVVPPLMALAVAAVIAAQGGNQYVLFTLSLSSHSALTGMAGLLVVLWAALGHLQDGRLGTARILALCAGVSVALLSKLEFGAGAVACLAAMAFVQTLRAARESCAQGAPRVAVRHYTGLGLVCVLPAAAAYGLLGQAVGWGNLLTGLTGFGLAGTACPWWPTGLGLFGALAALGLGLPFVAAASLPWLAALFHRHVWRYLRLWALAAAGGLLYGGYYYYMEFVFSSDGVGKPLLYHVADLTRLNTLLLPVMWYTLPASIWLTWRILAAVRRQQPLATPTATDWLLAVSVLALAARGLFGAHTNNVTQTALAAIPPLLLLAGRGLLELASRFEAAAGKTTGSAVSARAALGRHWPALVVAGYAGLHVLGLAAEGASGAQRYTWLESAAGRVRIYESTGLAVYEYVAANTGPDDYVLSLAYGGGINFAARRPVPTHSSQFIHVAPPQEYLQADLDGLRRHGPALVIADDNTYLGAGYGWWPPYQAHGGYLVPCHFPRIPWYASQPAYAFDTPLPVVDFVLSAYEPQAKVGEKVIWAPRQ